MTETRTPERGCAQDEHGRLKEAKDIPWLNSPSDENRLEARLKSIVFDKDNDDDEGVSRRTRRRKMANVDTQAVAKPKQSKNKKQKNANRQPKSKVVDETLEPEEASDEEETSFAKFDALDLGDNQVVRSKSSQSADIRLIFNAETRVIEGQRVKGYLCTICIFESHYTKYMDLCEKNNIEPNERALPSGINKVTATQTLEPYIKRNPVYTPQRLLDQIIKLIVSDDQAFRLVEKPEFRELILLLRPSTREADIPHRTKMRSKIMGKAQEAVCEIRAMFKQVKGLVSFTFDTWTSRAGDPYMAVTAHFVTHPPNQPTEWLLDNFVIGFSHISGNHGGENLARVITRAIDRFNLRSKIGWFTSDNASVNDTTMVSLADPGMAAEDILDFNPRERRIRCAAHVLNLAARAFIEGVAPTPAAEIRKKLTGTKRKRGSIYDSDEDDDYEDPDAEETAVKDTDDVEAADFDVGDLLGKALALIVQIRASAQVRKYFAECCEKMDLKPLELKKWVRTRWSSMYELLTRLILLRPAVDFFTTHVDRYSKVPKLKNGRTYSTFTIQSGEWEILIAMAKVLQGTAKAQHAFSSETIPTIWRNIPFLEFLQTKWEGYIKDPEYATVVSGLERGLKILKKYYVLSDDTSVNLICHVLNPALKMGYIKRKWDAVWIERARDTIESALKTYKQQIKNDVPAGKDHEQSQSDVSTQIESVGGYASAWMAEAVWADSKANKKDQSELDSYLNSPTEPKIDTNILVWWGRHAIEYPTLAAMARDYLAIQGSAVASERCFSSGGLTGTDRRNRLNPETFEALQILKNAYKKDTLFQPIVKEVREEYVESETDPLLAFNMGVLQEALQE